MHLLNLLKSNILKFILFYLYAFLVSGCFFESAKHSSSGTGEERTNSPTPDTIPPPPESSEKIIPNTMPTIPVFVPIATQTDTDTFIKITTPTTTDTNTPAPLITEQNSGKDFIIKPKVIKIFSDEKVADGNNLTCDKVPVKHTEEILTHKNVTKYLTVKAEETPISSHKEFVIFGTTAPICEKKPLISTKKHAEINTTKMLIAKPEKKHEIYPIHDAIPFVRTIPTNTTKAIDAKPKEILSSTHEDITFLGINPVCDADLTTFTEVHTNTTKAIVVKPKKTKKVHNITLEDIGDSESTFVCEAALTNFTEAYTNTTETEAEEKILPFHEVIERYEIYPTCDAMRSNFTIEPIISIDPVSIRDLPRGPVEFDFFEETTRTSSEASNKNFFTVKTAAIASLGIIGIIGGAIMLPTLASMTTAAVTPMLVAAHAAGGELVAIGGTNPTVIALGSMAVASTLAAIRNAQRTFQRDLQRTYHALGRWSTQQFSQLARTLFNPGLGHGGRVLGNGAGFGLGCGARIMGPGTPTLFIPLMGHQQTLQITAPVEVQAPATTPAVAAPTLPAALEPVVVGVVPVAATPIVIEPPAQEQGPPIIEIESLDTDIAFDEALHDPHIEDTPPPATQGEEGDDEVEEGAAEEGSVEEGAAEEEDVWHEIPLGPADGGAGGGAAAAGPSSTTTVTLAPIRAEYSDIQEIKNRANVKPKRNISKKIKKRLDKPFASESELTEFLIDLDAATQDQLQGFVVAVGELNFLERGLHAFGSKKYSYKYYSIRISRRLL